MLARAPRKRHLRAAKKVIPGKAISDTSATSSITTTGHEEDAQDEVWVCAVCSEQWEVGSDRWIVCDDCDRENHLQCSGIKYRARDYYKLDIDSMEFFCLQCN